MKIVVCKFKHLYLSFKIKGTCDYWMLRKCLFAVQTLICLALRRWYMTSMILFVSEQGARTDLPCCMGDWMGPVELLQESGELPDRLPGGVAKCLCRPGLAVPEFMESEQKYKHASDYNKKNQHNNNHQFRKAS